MAGIPYRTTVSNGVLSLSVPSIVVPKIRVGHTNGWGHFFLYNEARSEIQILITTPVAKSKSQNDSTLGNQWQFFQLKGNGKERIDYLQTQEPNPVICYNGSSKTIEPMLRSGVSELGGETGKWFFVNCMRAVSGSYTLKVELYKQRTQMIMRPLFLDVDVDPGSIGCTSIKSTSGPSRSQITCTGSIVPLGNNIDHSGNYGVYPASIQGHEVHHSDDGNRNNYSTRTGSISSLVYDVNDVAQPHAFTSASATGPLSSQYFRDELNHLAAGNNIDHSGNYGAYPTSFQEHEVHHSHDGNRNNYSTRTGSISSLGSLSSQYFRDDLNHLAAVHHNDDGNRNNDSNNHYRNDGSDGGSAPSQRSCFLYDFLDGGMPAGRRNSGNQPHQNK